MIEGDGSPALPGLYLHVPFCSEICPYCDFAVRRGGSDRRAQAASFVESVEAEIRGLCCGELLPEAPDLAECVSALVEAPFDTVYLGGGTPSYLPAEDLERLIDALHRFFHLESDCRVYLEANPEDVDAEAVASWHRLGVHTLSLGVQSLRDDRLRILGRRHDPAAARRAVALAKDAGFATVSVDLIYGVPGQSLESWDAELRDALALGADHLSLYELEIHERTVFGKRKARGEVVELPDALQSDLFLRTHEILRQAGWDVYEVSNFARRPEYRSRHNAKYWHHVPYLGLGPSAHSFVADWRFWNERNEPTWRRLIDDGTSPIMGWEKLPACAVDLELLMLGLRLAGGVDLDRLRSVDADSFVDRNRRRLESWSRDGLLTFDNRHLLPSRRGMAVADRLAAELEL